MAELGFELGTQHCVPRTGGREGSKEKGEVGELEAYLPLKGTWVVQGLYA